MVHQEEIRLETRRHGEMHNITPQVIAAVRHSGSKTGIVQIFNVGSTASVGLIEFEPGLQQDLPEKLDDLIPPGRDYGHEEAWHDGNAHSHLQATLLGQSLTLPVSKGAPVLGTWQQVFHLECDIKPRSRRIVVTVVGDQDK